MPAQQRRKFIQTILTGSVVAGTAPMAWAKDHHLQPNNFAADNRFKISLNAYSFNAPLMAKKTTLDDVMEFCAKEGFDAIDITGYYFPGYPEIPSDEYIYHLKNKAHRLGLGISGTGVRNEFTDPDAAKRTADVLLVKKWIEVAAKLGAPVIRIFAGKTLPAGYGWEEVAGWVTEAINSCVAYGKQKGVIVALQNHNDFVKTAAQTIDLLQRVNSEWFGLVLDTGSFVTEEPYSEIEKTTSYAVNWQIKEKLNYQGTVSDMDLDRLCRIIHASTYRGYLPIETLSPGDPFTLVPPFLQKVKTALAKAMANA
ncbi:MAG: sugar phosphate isomerase/epimerase [Chitinophagaceae bacterium]|nr:MAG: sugar phosphate isomerase/epimerase [Chitinophagaceae bacterium]